MNLDGRRVLVVEDEYMLARDLQRELVAVGVLVLGPEPSVARALDRIEAETLIDAAVLDVNLDGELVFPVAAELDARQVPYLFSTGYGDDVVRARFPGAIICDKPLETRRLFAALDRLMGD